MEQAASISNEVTVGNSMTDPKQEVIGDLMPELAPLLGNLQKC